MAYVYRFRHYLTNEIIYIGQTTRNMKSRMSEHFGKRGHLPKKCINSVGKIEYMDAGTNANARLIELYLINKYKPKYNRDGKVYDEQTSKYSIPMSIAIGNKWNIYEVRKKSFIGFRALRIFSLFGNNKKSKKSDDVVQEMIDTIFNFFIYYLILVTIVEFFKSYF